MDPSRAAAERELRALAAELKAVADAQVARVEEAISRLRAAIADAEAARAGLERGARPAPPPADPVHARVWALQDAGLPPERIAAETGLDAGEVALVLGLRRLRGAP